MLNNTGIIKRVLLFQSMIYIYIQSVHTIEFLKWYNPFQNDILYLKFFDIIV